MITTDWLLEIALRAAGVLALTAVLVRTVSRGSASLRHLAWAIALGGVILVPLLSRVMPVRLAVLPQAPIMAVRDDLRPTPAPSPQVETQARGQGQARPRSPRPSSRRSARCRSGFPGRPCFRSSGWSAPAPWCSASSPDS